jgi:hypothetical protein
VFEGFNLGKPSLRSLERFQYAGEILAIFTSDSKSSGDWFNHTACPIMTNPSGPVEEAAHPMSPPEAEAMSPTGPKSHHTDVAVDM